MNISTDSDENMFELITQYDIYDTCELIEKETELQINKLKELMLIENTLCCVEIKVKKHPETLKLRSVLDLTVIVWMYENCAYQNNEKKLNES